MSDTAEAADTVTDACDVGFVVSITVTEKLPAKTLATSPISGQPPGSFFILPNRQGPVLRVFGSDGNAKFDIHYQPNHPNVGNPHVHEWNGQQKGPPEPVPPGSRIPSRPVAPPDSQGPYSPWPRQPTPILGPIGPAMPSPSVPIFLNPCLLPIMRSLPLCSTPVAN